MTMSSTYGVNLGLSYGDNVGVYGESNVGVYGDNVLMRTYLQKLICGQGK